jgi:hypothetical protein
VYVVPFPTSFLGLAGRVQGAVTTVTHVVLTNVRTGVEYRHRVCRATDSARTEHL